MNIIETQSFGLETVWMKVVAMTEELGQQTRADRGTGKRELPDTGDCRAAGAGSAGTGELGAGAAAGDSGCEATDS